LILEGFHDLFDFNHRITVCFHCFQSTFNCIIFFKLALSLRKMIFKHCFQVYFILRIIYWSLVHGWNKLILKKMRIWVHHWDFLLWNILQCILRGQWKCVWKWCRRWRTRVARLFNNKFTTFCLFISAVTAQVSLRLNYLNSIFRCLLVIFLIGRDHQCIETQFDITW